MKKKLLLSKERPTTTLSINVPVDVLEDLQQVAQDKDISSVEALIQFYVGQGLRQDLVALRRKHSAEQAKQILGKHHIDPKVIEEVVAVMS
jgi:hypothetical protein